MVLKRICNIYTLSHTTKLFWDVSIFCKTIHCSVFSFIIWLGITEPFRIMLHIIFNGILRKYITSEISLLKDYHVWAVKKIFVVPVTASFSNFILHNNIFIQCLSKVVQFLGCISQLLTIYFYGYIYIFQNYIQTCNKCKYIFCKSLHDCQMFLDTPFRVRFIGCIWMGNQTGMYIHPTHCKNHIPTAVILDVDPRFEMSTKLFLSFYCIKDSAIPE